MRAAVIAVTGVLSFGLAGFAGAAPPSGVPNAPITCASPRVERSYQEGLQALHAGRNEQALKDFADALKRDPECAMALCAQSRVLSRLNRAEEAVAAAARAEEAAKLVDDRERRIITGWAKFVKADAAQKTKVQGEVRNELDTALTMYADDPELWILRGEMAESAVRANPFYLTAFRLQPNHALAATWKPTVKPLPELTPEDRQGQGAMQASEGLPMPGDSIPLFEGLGKLTHPITTKSTDCQNYYEQGLRCWHSYVSPMGVKNSAARNFVQAAHADPEAPMPYWGLSLVLTNGDKMKPLHAANQALDLALKHGSDKEKRLCTARLLEMRGNSKREEFLDTLDSAIAAYPDDVELWIWRGKSVGGSQAIVYQLAAHRVQPEHPSPNHELVHNYEGIDRPALGWPYTEMYRRSAPNMPHANHMQAHLATRLGRWDDAIDCTRMSRKKSLEGFPELDPSHHIDILMRALGHEGRFQEAEAEPRAYRNGLPWARLIQLKGDTAALEAWAEGRMKTNSPDGFYIGAVAKLDKGDLPGAEPLLANVETQFKSNKRNIYRFNEVKGRYLVMKGEVDEGLKLLREAGAQAVKDSGLHAWGGGSYQLEVWGEAALKARKWDEAEEAFHEALAHEHGSIIGALGMQVVWEQRGRTQMARHYADRAAAIWRRADAGSLDRHLARLRALAAAPMVKNN
jgi:tetratricopeptide (TPR) repeat protein